MRTSSKYLEKLLISRPKLDLLDQKHLKSLSQNPGKRQSHQNAKQFQSATEVSVSSQVVKNYSPDCIDFALATVALYPPKNRQLSIARLLNELLSSFSSGFELLALVCRYSRSTSTSTASDAEIRIANKL